MQRTRNPWRGFVLVSVAALVAGLAACDFILGNELNPKYCAAHPDDADCMREMPMGCSSSAQCAEPTAVCLVEERTCVQCTTMESSACMGTTPVCGADNTCGACSKHSDCASAACLPTGACGSDAEVAYVDPSGTGTACTQAAPCKKVDDALKTSRSFVKLSGVTDEAVVVEGGRNVTFLADGGAKLTRASGGPILTVKDDGTSLRVFDLTISDAPNNAGGYGLLVPAGSGAPAVALNKVTLQNNPGGGISVAGGTLTVSQSIIRGNQGGGISVTNAAFEITNNFIYRNGNSTTASVGGASLAPMAASASVFAFNTVADNQIQNSGALAGGVFCDTSGFAAVNNIIVRNYVNNDANRANANTSGICTFPTSAIAASVTALAFVRPDDNPYDYHLRTGSSAIDQATTASSVVIDADGEARPQGAQKDSGADEHKP
jgi:hypothetical protein